MRKSAYFFKPILKSGFLAFINTYFIFIQMDAELTKTIFFEKVTYLFEFQ